MGLFSGALGVTSARNSALTFNPFGALAVDIQSLFFGFVFVAILLILAYLTNPTEASFRTFLTELSFRRHLTKLHESQDADADDHRESGLHYTSLRLRDSKESSKSSDLGLDASTYRFRFTNRASISLRTPTHIFRSFGILTVAAVTPLTDASSAQSLKKSIESADSTVAGTWFIGAFGRWWVGGTVELSGKDAWTKEEDSVAGVLGIKSLDFGDPFKLAPINVSRPSLPSSIVVTKPKSTDRVPALTLTPDDSPTHSPSRSSTPPPLPKSASLPLHASRTLVSTPDTRLQKRQPSTGLPSPAESVNLAPPMLRAAPTIASVDQAPAIVELLKKLTSSQAATTDARNQLIAFQSSSSVSHANLQSTVDTHREKKREEDAARLDTKTRTKTLEENKRQAESNKREAERKLKAAQTARDRAVTRIGRLGNDVDQLQARIAADDARIARSGVDTLASEAEISDEIELKKKEIRVAEDVVAALALRARELEEKVKEEKTRLEKAKEDTAEKRREASLRARAIPSAFSSRTIPFQPTDLASSRPPALFSTQDSFAPATASVNTHQRQRYFAEQSSTDLPQLTPEPLAKDSTADLLSRRIRSHSVTGPPMLSLPSDAPSAVVASARANGYAIFDEDIASSLSLVTNIKGSHQPQTHTFAPFSPFAESDAGDASPLSPFTKSLIPTSLFQSLDAEASPRITSTEDIFFEATRRRDSLSETTESGSQRDWNSLADSRRRRSSTDLSDGLYSSPTSGSFYSGSDRTSSERFDLQRAARSPLLAQPAGFMDQEDGSFKAPGSNDSLGSNKPSRRWFSHSGPKATAPKEKNGLNPDAKVFSFKGTTRSLVPQRSQQNIAPAPPVMSNLPPSVSLGRSAASSIGYFFSPSLAFVPSPAEREALKRAMGGNASFDRLSDPSSPPPLHSARSSVVDLPSHSAMASAWASASPPADMNISMGGRIAPPSHKISLSSLWSKGKSGSGSEGNGSKVMQASAKKSVGGKAAGTEH
ncbi:hypothetical protein BOTBODRAFT_26202 [Botryobasidium botryosum FD-172 SS1]|uniref:Proteophosphoglycan ppg4 n=1 Tax=Botryobasidium botryosum (strain FD-172 SS1) TaxID=930990 RepID=A0A067N489_BOTB1|nr:hypothetical protein BOTBODRAFT_26202 [Botryobasidium botryosum FD-172 SS1]